MPTIKDLKVHIVTGEIKNPFFGAQGWVRVRSSLIVEIITSCEDIIGYRRVSLPWLPAAATGCLLY